jgi:hypothetical protein
MHVTVISRRHLLGGLAAAATFQPNQTLLGHELGFKVPLRAITRGPRFLWRGYYDKFLFDVTNRFQGMHAPMAARCGTPRRLE